MILARSNYGEEENDFYIPFYEWHELTTDQQEEVKEYWPWFKDFKDYMWGKGKPRGGNPWTARYGDAQS